MILDCKEESWEHSSETFKPGVESDLFLYQQTYTTELVIAGTKINTLLYFITP